LHLFWKGGVKFIKCFKGGTMYKRLGTSGVFYSAYNLGELLKGCVIFLEIYKQMDQIVRKWQKTGKGVVNVNWKITSDYRPEFIIPKEGKSLLCVF
jgi:hypothetical protein